MKWQVHKCAGVYTCVAAAGVCIPLTSLAGIAPDIDQITVTSVAEERTVFQVPESQTVFQVPHEQTVFQVPYEQTVFQVPDTQTIFHIPQQVDFEIIVEGMMIEEAAVSELADGIWLLTGEFGEALALLIAPGHLEIFSSQGETNIYFEGFNTDEVLQLLGDGPTPVPQCGSAEHLCQCPVPAVQSCSGIALISYKCCPDNSFCGCHKAVSPTGCTRGVRAYCFTTDTIEE